MAEHATALLHALDTAVANVARLEQSLTLAFDQHPDAQIITSFPGLSTVLGARILAEIGDDRSRFATARGLKAFAGTAPVTRASGMKTVVTRRVVRNKRLGQAAYLWALPMLAHSPGAHAHFTARRARPLHRPTRTRRQLQRRRAQPDQPRHGDAAPLPTNPTALRRVPGLPEPTRYIP